MGTLWKTKSLFSNEMRCHESNVRLHSERKFSTQKNGVVDIVSDSPARHALYNPSPRSVLLFPL
jgi:hypothetical protein